MIQKLREIKKERGISNEKMAREIGVSLQTVSRWFAGKAKPSIHVEEKLEKFINGQ